MAESIVTADRFSALKKLMQKNNLDGLVVTNNLDQFYLSNFFFYPNESVFLIHPKGIVCFTRELYVEPFGKFAPYMEVIGGENRVAATVAKVKELGLKNVGFDAEKESFLNGELMLKSGLVQQPSFITELRKTKDEAELKVMRESNRIAYLTYEYILPRVKTGMTECEVAAEMEKFMRGHGATSTSFNTIVAFGANSANPHHETGDTKLKEEDAVLVDFGCVYKGYCSDMTRSWWHGKKEPAEYKKIWNIVDKARTAGVKALRPGVAAGDIDRAARSVIEAAGYGKEFFHTTGHAIGLVVHDRPILRSCAPDELEENFVVTVEPGIYFDGRWGIRLEDSYLLTKDGSKKLTHK